MNVENRKLFRNKDARSRLASMGGIMGSSPELLGEVQKFSNGQEVKIPNTDTETTNNIISKYLEVVQSYKKPPNMSQEVYDQRIKDYLIYELVMTREYDADGNQIPKEMTPEERAYGERAVNEALSDISPYSKMQGLANDYITGQQGNEDRALYDRLNRLAFVRDELPQDVPQSVVDSLSGRTFRDDDQAAAVAQEFVAMPEVDTQFSANLSNIAPNMYGPYGLAPFPSPQVNERSGILSSESMMNEQAPRPTVSSLEAPSISGMPLVEGPGPAPALPMNTAADSTDPLGVLTNPRTGEPMTLLPPQERSPQVLDSRSGIRTLLDRYILGDKTGRKADPRVATESLGFLDSDAGQEISPEVAQELKMLEDLRTARSINAPQGTLEGLKTAGADLLEVGNIAMGVPMYVGGQAVAGAADLAGYLGGGGKFSRSMFGFSDDMQDKTNELFLPEGTPGGIPRLYSPEPTSAYSQRINPLTMEALNQLSSEELAAQRAQVRAESLAAIENADPSVFSEGSPTELTPAGRAQRAADSVTRMSEQGMPKGLSAEAINRIQEQQAQEAAEKEMDAAGRRLIAGQPREVGPVEIQPEVDSSLSFPRITGTINSALEAGGTFVESILGKERTDVLRQNIEKVNERIDSKGERTKIKEAAEFADELNPQGPNFVPAPKKVTPKKEVELKDDNSLVVDGEQIVDTGTNSGSKDKPTTTSNRYAGYKKEIQDLLGGGKKDKNKEKWEDFSLAMFRIAAGKDPDAVANIAAGLAEAAVDKKTSRSIQQDRDDKINLLAMKMTGDERIANIRASDAYGKRRDPLTQMYMLADTLYADGSGDYENYVDALAAAKTQVSKDYGSGFDGGQPSEEQLVKTITTKAEFDALPSGTEFIQNGQKRKKP